MVAQEEQASDLLVPDKSTHFIGQHCLDGGKAGRVTRISQRLSRILAPAAHPSLQPHNTVSGLSLHREEHAHSINIIKRVDEGGTFIAFRNGHALP